MPPAADAQCTYLSHWVSTKLRWSLTVDRASANARAQENYRRDVGGELPPRKTYRPLRSRGGSSLKTSA